MGMFQYIAVVLVGNRRIKRYMNCAYLKHAQIHEVPFRSIVRNSCNFVTRLSTHTDQAQSNAVYFVKGLIGGIQFPNTAYFAAEGVIQGMMRLLIFQQFKQQTGLIHRK